MINTTIAVNLSRYQIIGCVLFRRNESNSVLCKDNNVLESKAIFVKNQQLSLHKYLDVVFITMKINLHHIKISYFIVMNYIPRRFLSNVAFLKHPSANQPTVNNRSCNLVLLSHFFTSWFCSDILTSTYNMSSFLLVLHSVPKYSSSFYVMY